MIFHFFKTALRSLRANKVYSLLNVAGLGVGIAVCLVIFVFIQYEQSFDAFHSKKANIYRILTKGDKPGDIGLACVPFPLPTALAHDFPDWKVTGLWSVNEVPVKTFDETGKMEKSFKEKDGMFAVDNSFFNIFDFPWLAGDAAHSFADPNGVVLSKRVAERYFGDWKKAIGRNLQFFGQGPLARVSGILADPPPNTDLKMDIVINYASLNFNKSTDWFSLNSNHGCYVLLPPAVGPAAADRQLAALSKKYRTPDNKNTQLVQSLAEVHFDTKAGNYSGKMISRERIQSLWLIAGFILLIACVNFVNIATAQAVNRAKEVGVRKVLGGARRQLRLQFLLEALMLVVSGVLLAVMLFALLITPVGQVLEIPVTLQVLGQSEVILFLAAMIIGVTFLAGFYPALVLSRFNPITALKAKLASRSAKGLTLRRGLVVFQFVIAQALIIGTFLVVRQLNHFTHASMGFDREAIIDVSFPGDSLSRTKWAYLRNRLVAMKDIKSVSYHNSTPATDGDWWSGLKYDHAPKDAPFAVIEKWVDVNYLATYSLPLVAGRNFTRTDSIREFVVNETVVRKLGLHQATDILNKQIVLGDGGVAGLVVGVVKDFHQGSLKDSLAPLILFAAARFYNEAGIKLTGNDLPASLAAIRRVWAQVFPDYVFQYSFLDEKIAGFYKEEAKMSTFYTVFASIAIFLSCLGLYGLASFMAAQRLKEVGIRKVLGASVSNIVYLFTREFIVLIGIAFLIAAPIAWYFVNEWVQQYVFRIPISGWVFLGGGMAALLIALATVSWQALKAAAVNPVKNLRTE